MNTFLEVVWRSFLHARTHPTVRLGVRALALSAVALLVAGTHAWQAANELADVQSLLADQRRAAALAARTRELHHAYRAVMDRLAEHDRRRPALAASASPLSQAQMVQALSQLAERSGLKLLDETYDPLRERGASGWQISLAAQADYPATRAFLDGLPALVVPVQAERIRIDTARGGEPRLKVQMLLRVPSADEAGPSQESAR